MFVPKRRRAKIAARARGPQTGPQPPAPLPGPWKRRPTYAPGTVEGSPFPQRRKMTKQMHGIEPLDRMAPPAGRKWGHKRSSAFPHRKIASRQMIGAAPFPDFND